VTLIMLGLLSFVLILPNSLYIGENIALDVQTILVGGAACIIGQQLIIFAALTTFFATSEGLILPKETVVKINKYITVKTGFWAGFLLTLVGLILISIVVYIWAQHDFGPLPLKKTLRLSIPGTIALALGIQTIFSSFFMSILGLKRKM